MDDFKGETVQKTSFVLQKVAYNIKEYGTVHLIRKLADTLWREIAQGGEHLFYIINDHLLFGNAYSSGPAELVVERFRLKSEISVTAMNDLRQFVEKKYMREDVSRMYLDKLLQLFDDGAELTIGRLDGKIVGYLWQMHAEGHYTPYFRLFPLLPADGLVFGAHTLYRYRGLGILPTLIRYNCALLMESGARRVFATCKQWNQSSQRGILKAGMRYLNSARAVSLMGKRIVIWSNRKGIENWTP
jgi:hypothetical protein